VPGLLLAYGAGRAMNALLFGVGPGDPATIAAGVAVVMVVTIAGSMIPAFRAVRVSPMLAMRAE
jgi:ABC-type antimicrobial peptide transport system permease subunit